MKKKRPGFGPILILAAGVLLLIVGTVPLLGTRDVLEYALPAAGLGAGDIQLLAESREDIDASLAEAVSATAVGGRTDSSSIRCGGGEGQEVSVCQVCEGWFDVYPVLLCAGRRIDAGEMRRGERVIMLDAELAFALFGQEIPEKPVVKLAEREYTVVGIFRYRWTPGTACDHTVYIPLRSILTEGEDDAMTLEAPKPDVMLYSALPVANTGARTLFESRMKTSWKEGGSFWSLGKEAMRRTIVLRIIALVLGTTLLARMLSGMGRLARRQLERYRQRLRAAYFVRTLPALIGMLLSWLLAYGAILAGFWLLLSFVSAPVYVFTEWVPDNFVSWSSLYRVFRTLTRSAAVSVKTGTPGLRAVEFYGGFVRWGVILVLLGAAVALVTGRNKGREKA